MIKFEKIKAGQQLFDVRRGTSFHAMLCGAKYEVWPVYVRSVDPVRRTVVASWNGNKDEVMPERRVTKYRAKRPLS